MTESHTAAPTPPTLITKKTLQSLAPLPDMALRILALLDDPNVSLRKIGDIIVRDVGISASMLRMANSAIFGLRGRVGSISDALRVIGTAQARLLVLTSGVTQMSNKELTLYRLKNGAFMRHSEAVAVLTMALSRNIALAGDAEHTNIGVAYSAGLLHDVGKVIINGAVLEHYPERRITLDAIMAARNCTLLDAEMLLCGMNHLQVADRLAEMWALPPNLRDAITGHHAMADAPDPGSLAWCVALANAAVAEADPSYPRLNTPAPVAAADLIDAAYLKQAARQAVIDAQR